MTTWPKTVEPLNAKTLLRGPYDDPKRPGCGCLAYHADERFRGLLSRARFRRALTDTTGTWDWALGYNLTTHKAVQVRAFNAAVERCGYVRRGHVYVREGRAITRVDWMAEEIKSKREAGNG